MASALALAERREISDIEVYSKLIAMTVTGIEEAIGESLTGGFINLVVKQLETLLDPDTSSPGSFLEWVNSKTVLRLNTYRVRGKLVREEGKGKAFYLISYECPIRQVLYLEDLPGGKSLCRIVCSFLSRGLSSSLGGRVTVSLERLGPNACLIRAGLNNSVDVSVVEKLDIVSRKPSPEEYERGLLEFYRVLLRSIGWALYTLLGSNPAMSYRAGKNYGRLNGAAILAEGFEAEDIKQAVEIFNTFLGGFARVELVDSEYLRLVASRFIEIIKEAGVEHKEFILRIIQGFIAGVLEVLMGKRVDLRSTREENLYRVMVGG